MNKKNLSRCLAALLFLSMLSCGGKTQTEEVNKQQTATEEVKETQVVEGGSLNSFFPKSADGYEVVFTQEKDGFAQADLSKDGTPIATLAISDIANNAGAASKYSGASEKIEGFPAVANGSKGDAVLVADKYQVQVRSTADGFTADQRKEWIKKFDLKGLSQLKK